MSTLCSNRLSAQSLGDSETGKVTSGARKQLITLKLTSTNPPTVASCPIKITITNGGEFPIGVSEVAGLLVCHFTLTDAKGKNAALTQKGYETYCLDGLDYPRYSRRFVSIPKGQKKEWTIDLGPYFELKPGEWTVTAEMKDCYSEQVDVKTLREQYAEKPASASVKIQVAG